MGLMILSLGLSLTIVADKGASPYTAFLVGLSQTIGLTVGSWEFLLGVMFVLICSLIKKSKADYFSLITAFITGLGTDMWLLIFSYCLHPDFLNVEILLLFLGIILTGLGIATYIKANFSPIPVDGLMLIIMDRLKIKISTAKTLFNVVFGTIAFLIGGPVSVGTVLAMFLVGPFIGIFSKMIEKKFG